MLAKVRGIAEKTDVSDKDFLAVQVNITGKDEGVFYVEVKDHRISVEPYEYNDRNCAITISMTVSRRKEKGKDTMYGVFAFACMIPQLCII